MNTFDGKELVSQLLTGSRHINRMRDEINEVVKMMIGFLALCDADDFRGTIYVWSPRWNISAQWVMYPNRWIGDKPSIKYELLQGRKVLYTSDGRVNAPTSNVQMIHNDLPRLVEGIIREFPKIAGSCQPLIEASKVKW